MITPRNGTLDIIRAAAIVMVLACHFSSAFLPSSSITAILSVGGRGVDLFFVLSGWLLGCQLFREISQTGTIDLRQFWTRRWLRTLPAYYAIVFATWALLIVNGKSAIIDWRYLIFVQNYLPESRTLGVTWSLCVEEHFYLIVAPLIIFAFRSRWGVAFTGLLFLAVVSCHVMGWYPNSVKNPYEVYASHIRCEQCAIGVLLAWLSIFKPKTWTILRQAASGLFALSLLAILQAIFNRTIWPWYLPDYSVAGWGLIFGAWILLADSSAFFRERLSSAGARFIAARAYSLYLVHTEGVAVAKKLQLENELGRIVIATIASFLLAEVLYRFIERPFMKRRGRRLNSSRLPDFDVRADYGGPAASPVDVVHASVRAG